MYDPKDIPQWTNFKDNFINKPYIQKQQLYNWEVENYTWEDWAPVVARYYAIISQVDDAIGNVLKTIDEMSLEEDTIIIYTSDHGDMCGAHGMVDKHYIQYDDVVRVPLIVKWKGNIEEGMQNDKFVYNCLDLAPTILDILHIEKESVFHGKSLMPFLNGECVENWREEVIASYNGQQFGLYTQRMIRNTKWKYVWNTTDVDELYDMEMDADELINLIYQEEYNSVLLELRKKLLDELVAVNDGIGKNPMLRKALLSNRKN